MLMINTTNQIKNTKAIIRMNTYEVTQLGSVFRPRGSSGNAGGNSVCYNKVAKGFKMIANVQAAVSNSNPPRRMDNNHNSLIEAPTARRFKKRGCRAGKAHKAAAACSRRDVHKDPQ